MLYWAAKACKRFTIPHQLYLLIISMCIVQRKPRPKCRPAPNVLVKLSIFLCCNSSKFYLFFLLAVPILLIAAHALAQTKCKLLRDRVSRLGIRKYVHFPHGDRMRLLSFFFFFCEFRVPWAFNRLRVDATLELVPPLSIQSYHSMRA